MKNTGRKKSRVRNESSWVVALLCLSTAWTPNVFATSIRDQASVWTQKMSSDSGENTLIETWVSKRWLLDDEGSSLLQLGIQARNTNFASFSAGTIDDLWMVVPQANLLKSLNDQYSLIANLRFGAFSDFKQFGREDFRVEGAVILDRVESERFTWGLGVGRVSNFGRVIFVPLLHVLWTINERWLLDAFLPGKLELLYLPSSKLELGFSFNIVGSRYHIRSNTSGVDAVGAGQMNFGPIARVQLAPSLYLSGEAGMAFGRRLSLMDGNKEIVRFEPDSEIYARVGLQYRY